MRQNRTRDFTPADISNAEALYEKTGDPIYIALAIGAESAEPPFWAMTAARDLARKAEGAAANGNSRILRGKRLDAMVREFFRLYDEVPYDPDYVPPSLLAVIRNVLEKEGLVPDKTEYESQRKGLEVAWRAEAKGFELDPAGVPENARWRRMVREWGDQHTDFPYGVALDNPWKFARLLKKLDEDGKN
jgi:hypothetical protein